MSKHRLAPPARVRPRVGRIAAAAVSLVVTAIALLGGVGIIPLGGAGTAAGNEPTASKGQTPSSHASQPAKAPTKSATHGTTPTTGTTPSTATVTEDPTSQDDDPTSTGTSARKVASSLPASSGEGHRVVFSMSDQRVWLVGAGDKVLATYLVSGSLTNNLHPGSYAVYSRSRWAVGVDDSGVMQYFVRFTQGNHAAIGFHSIPTKNGKPLQKIDQLGTPQSHGCIRQKLSDAERMWNFARTGTGVVVLA